MRAELILDVSDGMGSLFSYLGLGFSDLKKDLIISGVPYLEVDELDAVNVVLRLAEKVLSGRLEVSNFLEGESTTHCIYLYTGEVYQQRYMHALNKSSFYLLVKFIDSNAYVG